MTVAAALPRPALRGYVHLGCALLAPGALVYLILISGSAAAYVGAAIFGAGLLLLFSVSAAYHLAPWPQRTRRIVGRIDHSTIFVAIAACYTPFCLRALPLSWRIPVLAVAWTIAAGGVALKVTWPAAPKWLAITCYLAAGWLGIVAMPQLSASLSPTALLVMASAGALYSLGAFAYAARWPNPAPRLFGHHEVFHVLVAAASLLLYGVVAIEVLPS